MFNVTVFDISCTQTGNELASKFSVSVDLVTILELVRCTGRFPQYVDQ
jgi:hypothetical protein